MLQSSRMVMTSQQPHPTRQEEVVDPSRYRVAGARVTARPGRPGGQQRVTLPLGTRLQRVGDVGAGLNAMTIRASGL